MEKYFTPEQIAEKLQVRPRTVRQWLRDGMMQGQKVSNQWRISNEDLQNFISFISKKKEKEEEVQTVIPLKDEVVDVSKPDKRSSDSEWAMYGRKLFDEMRKEGSDKYFKGIYSTGDTQEKYKSYEYKGESFRLFLSANEMRIVILRTIEFMTPGGAPEGFEVFGFDAEADVLLYSSYRGDFNQQYIEDSRRTKK